MGSAAFALRLVAERCEGALRVCAITMGPSRAWWAVRRRVVRRATRFVRSYAGRQGVRRHSLVAQAAPGRPNTMHGLRLLVALGRASLPVRLSSPLPLCVPLAGRVGWIVVVVIIWWGL